MPKYKLRYFNLKALGEPIRFMLSYLGEDFEDDRFEIADWPKVKPTTPFGKAPVLEVDGKELYQSMAITRYLAKQAKLAGKNDWEALQIDMAVDTVCDLMTAMRGFFYEQDESVKAQKKGPVLNDTVPFYLGNLDGLVKHNGGYLANNSLSWGDIYFIAMSDYLSFMAGKNIFDGYPNLQGLKDKVTSLPAIKAWIAKRPETPL